MTETEKVKKTKNKKVGGKERRRKRRAIPTTGQAHVAAGFNNTLITITDETGGTVAQGSTGLVGFHGSRKSTPFAASLAAEDVGRRAANLGIQQIAVYVKGPGSGRNSAIKSLRSAGLRVTSITDVTPIPHNGCRPKKRRRV